ncbi:MAG: hypothetical protein GYB53_04960 [Rhodobacteraceae bacterium]|nr:hypothetical protein [Paracoccaceae bacterium]MBR9822756.1 hypothetical protein [Paracoccaceae bacterium]
MDFVYFRDDFTLPYNEALGVVVIEVDGQKYISVASTFKRKDTDALPTAQVMQLLVSPDEYVNLFRALRFGTRSSLIFPNGDSYELSLRASSNALAAAANCWERNATGELKNNPFGDQGAGASAGNPFDSF